MLFPPFLPPSWPLQPFQLLPKLPLHGEIPPPTPAAYFYCLWVILIDLLVENPEGSSLLALRGHGVGTTPPTPTHPPCTDTPNVDHVWEPGQMDPFALLVMKLQVREWSVQTPRQSHQSELPRKRGLCLGTLTGHEMKPRHLRARRPSHCAL